MTSAGASGDSPASPPAATRWMALLMAITVGCSLVGFLVGIFERTVPRRARQRPRALIAKTTIAAPTYSALSTARVGPNGSWTSSLAQLQLIQPGLFDKVVRTPEMKAAALRDRLRTRAFDGAPPVIPHAIEQHSAASCLVCHGSGMWLGDRLATRVSHPHFTSCTQCHVEATGGPLTSMVAAPSESEANDFAGVLRAGSGTRAGPGAPPTIPHTTLLREDCMSCHGLIARPGLRTTHPWLQNCRQCHVAPAEFDQSPLAAREAIVPDISAPSP